MIMDPAVPSTAPRDGSSQISDPSDSQEPSTSNPAPCPASDQSTTTRTETFNSHTHATIRPPSVSTSPLSSISPLSSSAESVTQAAKKVEHLEGLDFSNFVEGEDPATLLSISGAPTSNSTELSSISSSSLPSTAGLLHSPAQAAAASIPSATNTTSMARGSPKANAETLRKIAPAPPIGTANPETTVNTVPGPGPVSQPQPRPSKAQKRSRKTAAQKRPAKRRKAGVYDDDEDGIIKAGNSPSDDESDEFTLNTTQTKSGRTIHRPTVFVPQQDSAAAAAPVSVPGATVSPAIPSTGQKNTPPRKKRRIVRKGKEVNITCERCERGYSPASNAIVFCDECNGAWHQFCHDPPIEMEVVNVKESQWFCSECRPVKLAWLTSARASNDATTVAGPMVTTTVYDASFLDAKNLVGGSEFTQTERLRYLSGLSHAALVNLLVRISDSNPELPFFPANLRDLRPSVFIAPSSTAKPLNPATNLSSQEQTTTQSIPPIPANTASQPTTDPMQSTGPITIYFDPEDYDFDSDYVPEHRLYPKPGNGFRLPPDSVDLDILLEDPACRTFSHALHGPAAKMREESGGGLEVASVGVGVV